MVGTHGLLCYSISSLQKEYHSKYERIPTSVYGTRIPFMSASCCVTIFNDNRWIKKVRNTKSSDLKFFNISEALYLNRLILLANEKENYGQHALIYFSKEVTTFALITTYSGIKFHIRSCSWLLQRVTAGKAWAEPDKVPVTSFMNVARYFTTHEVSINWFCDDGKGREREREQESVQTSQYRF